jgi:hypothetical protein
MKIAGKAFFGNGCQRSELLPPFALSLAASETQIFARSAPGLWEAEPKALYGGDRNHHDEETWPPCFTNINLKRTFLSALFFFRAYGNGLLFLNLCSGINEPFRFHWSN